MFLLKITYYYYKHSIDDYITEKSAAYSDQQLVVSDSDAWNTGYAAAAVYHVSDDRVYGLHDHRGVCSADFQFPENTGWCLNPRLTAYYFQP